MKFTAFLIKYAEIALKGKNRYLFEDALVKQIRIALKKVDGNHNPGSFVSEAWIIMLPYFFNISFFVGTFIPTFSLVAIVNHYFDYTYK